MKRPSSTPTAGCYEIFATIAEQSLAKKTHNSLSLVLTSGVSLIFTENVGMTSLVGGWVSRKVQNYADVIYSGLLRNLLIFFQQ